MSRAIVAQHVIQGLEREHLPNRTELVFILRERLALIGRIARGSGEAAPPTEEIYPETNVRTAIFDGIGVRALVPNVAAVSFALKVESSPRAEYVVYSPTGEVHVFSPQAVDSLLESPWVNRW